jgi:uncharacterized protein YjgD (DUF1641 family)
MNERIQELLKQATTDALYETRDAIDFLDNPVAKQQRELQLEKFAQLIVRECANIADIAEPFLASDLIKQHFGVEE